MKTMTIFGTRPEGIKMAPLVLELERDEEIENIIVNTAQHREMLDQVLQLFEIVPNYDLQSMEVGQTLEVLTNKIIYGISELLENERPNLVYVHGDTTTTFAAAYAAFLKKIPVAHVEAGLRTNTLHSPFPEEGNRRLVSRIATVHFAPTIANRDALVNENINATSIHVVGNTVIDALHYIQKQNVVMDRFIQPLLHNRMKTILLTTHRRENLNELESVFDAIEHIVTYEENVQVIFPVHKNPHVQAIAKRKLGSDINIHLVDPLDYQTFVQVMMNADVIVTDSGGIQEEAPAIGKSVVVVRETTERPEGILSGHLHLTGTSKERIVESIRHILSQTEHRTTLPNPFGNGDSAKKIVEITKRKYSVAKVKEFAH
ncbi:non-hydrolyzing UDP-N-acetylglucosamine 2-epimerase [Geomicrobium sp. JCM 19038]|uniref:non-hydrolyzing UDP-N-acetylglucosamine 2-epimerase n=1 Tax=Geomicrobium sp. JCM 19038 TaxID=1460635 RepID=UPI00045F1FF5|nr:UDP-N-acetylglucosamine 2-epimerase (non-hydrolyzing) [Geomicrobium sp. JCM 19038]GAK08438.1 UDP-N-acetylglucosamine 2-epimerase [Geomicrobium sp. JCM 19038]